MIEKIRISLKITWTTILCELFFALSTIKSLVLALVMLWTGRKLSDDEKANELIAMMIKAARGDEG